MHASDYNTLGSLVAKQWFLHMHVWVKGVLNSILVPSLPTKNVAVSIRTMILCD